MGKKLFFLIFILLFLTSPVRAFDFFYESIIEIDKNYFLIQLKGPQGKKKYLCSFDSFKCEEKEIDFSLKPKNFSNYFFSSDYKNLLFQIRIKPQKFLTLSYQKDNQIFRVLNFDQKIEMVFFSKDGSKVLLKNKDKFYLYSLTESKILKEFYLNYKGSNLTPSPSLKYLALYKNGSLNGNRQRKFLIFDIENQSVKEFLNDNLSYWDLLTENNKLFDFLTDEKLIFLSDHENFQTLYLSDLKNNKIEKIFPDKFLIKDFVVFEDKLFFIANKENPLKWDLYKYDFSRQEIKKLVDYAVYDTNLTIINNYLVFKKSDDLPPRVYFLDLRTYEIKRPEIHNPSEAIKIGEIKNYNNLWSVVLKPEEFQENKEYDLIVWLHGGPHRQTSLGYHPYFSYGVYDFLLEKLRKTGFLVIKIDYPGSFGYGRDFAEILKGKIGKIDSESVVKVIKEIEKEFKIKDKYLMGNSYGGYLSLKTIYDYPNLFSGAISINGVIDWWTLIKNNPSSIFRTHFNGPPNNKNLFLYDQASIFQEKERLKGKKILLIYGLEDTMVPYKQNFIFLKNYQNIAKVFYQKLNENHIIQKKDSLENIFFKIITFIKS